MITALRSRAFQAKWNRATRRDRRRVLRRVPRRWSPSVWVGSPRVSVLLAVGPWMLAGGVAWMVLL